MYTTRNSGWLGPTGYIQAYPKIYPKPTLRMRIAAWRRLLIYAAGLSLVPMMVISGVNLYASRMVAPSSSQVSLSEIQAKANSPGPKQPATLAITTLPPVGTEPDPGLKQLLNDWSADHPNHKWSVVVQGIGQDRRFAKLNPDEVFGSASLYKLQILYPLLQRHNLSTFEQVNTSAGRLSDCVYRMLRVSDNPCGEAVGTYVGWSKSDAKLKELGLKNTTLGNSLGTTADDMAILMKEIYDGPKFSTEAREYILGVLRSQTWRKGIPTGCNACTVANKTGDLSHVRHDVAIIEDAGRTYVLTIFTSGAPYSQIAQLTSQLQQYLAKPYF